MQPPKLVNCARPLTFFPFRTGKTPGIHSAESVSTTRRFSSPLLPVICSALYSLSVAPCLGQDKKVTEPLPVRAVTLFSSGVSYTMREGEVSGDATIPLAFRTTQINDILKSLILLDSRGTVQPAVYGAKDPVGRTLQSFAVNVTQPLDRAALLNRLRGARVEVKAAKSKGGDVTITGQIVSVESKTVILPGGAATVMDILNILSEAGLQSVNLEDVQSLRLLDERLNREFREALTLLASGADDKRRQVTLHFSGEGRRPVRVGYISEAPLWKVSYRLLISGAESKKGDTTAAKPYLQGWAMVENTTEDDWNGVHLSLISGRPVSFIQDLYQPLYLPRPVVPPDIIASPLPQIAEASIEDDPALGMPAPPALVRNGALAKSELRRGIGGTGGGGGGFGGGGRESNVALMDSMRQSVAAQATGEKSGELFRYDITTPVTLPRQQAAMIPILAQDVEGEKVSLYNADSDPRFPLNAYRLKNNTKLHLKGGPVTLFDGDTYAGDARMEDIPPGDSRLITYAVDLGVEGDRKATFSAAEKQSFLIRRGVLTVYRSNRSQTDYTLKNRDSKPRTVLVEQPYTPDAKLIEPAKAAERTPGFYRFSIAVPPGETHNLKVILEMPISEQTALLNGDFNALQVYIERGETPENIKAALREAVTRRRKVLDLRAQASGNDAGITEIERDQDRIRKNMTALDRNSALYQRYVKELDEQETRIQNHRKEAIRLRNAAATAEQEFTAYLDTMNIG